jgi:arsenate reductase
MSQRAPARRQRAFILLLCAMAEVGVDLGGHTSKTLERFLGERWDCVITVCDAANEACPVVPGAAQRLHWSFEDPSSATGTDEARLAVFRRVRDEIRTKLTAWLSDRRPADAITMRKR